MQGTVIDARDVDVRYMSDLLMKDKKLQVVDAKVYDDIPHVHIQLWCHLMGIYCLPTTELIDFLKALIVEGSTIEIGSGNGAVGRALDIPRTDSRFMENHLIAMMYAAQGQPVTHYGNDVEQLAAVDAIEKYKPAVVIGCWVTHIYKEEEHERGGNMFGIDEDYILDRVQRYIVVGNQNVHQKKRILDRSDFKLTTYSFPWIKSRASDPTKDVVYVWEKK